MEPLALLSRTDTALLKLEQAAKSIEFFYFLFFIFFIFTFQHLTIHEKKNTKDK